MQRKEVIGVSAPSMCVLTGPGQPMLDVDQVFGETGPGRQAVADAHTHPAPGREAEHQRQPLKTTEGHHPATAVGKHQHRSATAGLIWRKHVDLLRPPTHGSDAQVLCDEDT